MLNTRLILIITAAAALSGCVSPSSMTGIGGTSEYSCKAPKGVSCQSISGVYANATQRNLPSQQVGGDATSSAKSEKQQPKDRANAIGSAPYSGMPIRSETKVLRVWIAPWEDSEGDLNDQSYSYVVVDNGRWMIDHNRRNIASEYAPIRPPSGLNATNANGPKDSKGKDDAE